MSWTSRRRASPWAPSESSAALEVERSSYATFTGSFPPRKQRTTGGLAEFWKGKWHSLWTIASVAVGAVLLYKSMHHHRDASSMYDTTPISEWDHNHYFSMRDSFNNHNASSSSRRQRNLLIAQVGESASRPFAGISSRPNRAYARRGGWDYLLHTGEEDACGTVRVLNHILTRQEEEETKKSYPRAPYDAILFLPLDAVIMNLDYPFLALISENQLVAAGETKSNLFVWNTKHKQSLDVARLWLDLGDDSLCDIDSLFSAIEMTVGGKASDLSKYVQPLQISDTGQVEPRLIKFLPDDESEQDLPQTMGLLESVADSVCYRYYPRCEVL